MKTTTKVAPFSYRRSALAKSSCDALEGRGIADASSGLFLAAPRRTGKSTFLREDLVPEMQARGWETLYVDLWADRERDPADMIVSRIREAMNSNDGLVLKTAKKVGLHKLNVFGTLALDIDKIGLPGGLTVADALVSLRKKTGKPLALLVDEAQHALSTKAGVNAMFALKAARDQLNQVSGDRGLYLVMTGSNRDKLAHLVLRKEQPFYGAGVKHFPLLGRGFVEAYAAWLRPQFSDGGAFSADALERAFDLVGHRPEMLKQLVGHAVVDLGGAHALEQQLVDGAAQLKARAWQEFESAYQALPAPQKAVLDAVARHTPAFEPFAETSMATYVAALGQRPSNSAIQAALDALRGKELIWRAGRGDYAFEDDGLRDWYLENNPDTPIVSGTKKEQKRTPKPGREAAKKK